MATVLIDGTEQKQFSDQKASYIASGSPATVTRVLSISDPSEAGTVLAAARKAAIDQGWPIESDALESFEARKQGIRLNVNVAGLPVGQTEHLGLYIVLQRTD